MSEDVEEVVRGIRLRAPSARLDQCMAQLLAARPPIRRPLISRPVALWQCAAACAVCAVAAYALESAQYRVRALEPVPAAAEVRYVVQVQDAPFNIFDRTRYPRGIARVAMPRMKLDKVEASGSI